MSIGLRDSWAGYGSRLCRLLGGLVLASAAACDDVSSGPSTAASGASADAATPLASGGETAGPGVAASSATAPVTVSSATVDVPPADAAASHPVGDASTAPFRDAGETTAPLVDAAGQLTLEAIRGQYTSWRRHTEQPVNISAQVFGLCRLPTAAEDDFVESVHGHELYLLDWLNEAAHDVGQVMSGTSGSAEVGDAGGRVVFPVGAAIVKEKLVLGEDGQYVLAALGLMVKRAPGFDSTTADWEFGYWEPGVGMSAGAVENAACGTCHASSRTDFVFLDASWRLEP